MSIGTFAAAQILRLLPRARLSRAVGRLCDQSLPPGLSNAVAKAYVRAYRVDMTDVVPPTGAYPSFDAFFTRPLKDGARAVDAAPIVSPADGCLVDSGDVDAASFIRVKGRPYEVGELLGSNADAARFADGSFAVIYLSPRDYHRVHSPVDGRLVCVRGMPGDLFPVNSIGEQHVPRLFVRNHRVAMMIDAGERGLVSVVMVGAMIVGRISVVALRGESVDPGTHDVNVGVVRGDEIGTFHLGSTVVLLASGAGRFSRAAGPVRYGEGLVH